MRLRPVNFRDFLADRGGYHKSSTALKPVEAPGIAPRANHQPPTETIKPATRATVLSPRGCLSAAYRQRGHPRAPIFHYPREGTRTCRPSIVYGTINGGTEAELGDDGGREIPRDISRSLEVHLVPGFANKACMWWCERTRVKRVHRAQ